MTRPNNTVKRTARAALATGAAATVLALAAGCGNTSTGSTGNVSRPSAGDVTAVLPVQSNPIKNTSTNQAVIIQGVFVENNVDESGKAVDDHLEIAVTNSGTADLTSFEVYYTITDPTTSDTENYYTQLPTSFSIAAGASRAVHLDNTGATDHFPVNQYSPYFTDTNALDVEVEVSAVDSAPQTAKVTKDAGGAEEAD